MAEFKLTDLTSHGGWAAKVEPDALAQVLRQLPVQQDPDLLVGFDTSDDAAVYKITDDIAMIQTVDIFPPVVDDPYSYGQIAAANSLSDVYAMGGKPKLVMNILCIPEDLDPEITKAILQGGYSKADEAGAIICGGHTIKDKEPKYGLCVSGFVHPDHILTNSSAKPGDVLVLTKAIGTGILNTAIKADLLEADTITALTESMASLNKAAAAAMEGLPVHSCTDITGFGLLGHIYEMAHASGTTFVLESSKIPFLPQALEMAEMGIVPAGAYNNRRWISCSAAFAPGVPLAVEDALFDPQTSGGLLITIAPEYAPALMDRLQEEAAKAEDRTPYGSCLQAAVIGYVKEKDGPSVQVVL